MSNSLLGGFILSLVFVAVGVASLMSGNGLIALAFGGSGAVGLAMTGKSLYDKYG